MLTASYLQNSFYPVVPPGNETTQLNQIHDPDSEAGLASEDSEVPQVSGVDLADTSSDVNSETLTDETESAASPNQPMPNTAELQPVPADDEGTQDEDAISSTPNSQFYTLGSISSESDSRYLVTFSSAGGTVRRVELNFRDKKDRYRYRDLEYWGGYLGELECSSTALGCKIGVVGDGTPAQKAGLQAGDIIKSLDGVPVADAEDFAAMMLKTKSGEAVSLGYQRDSRETHVEIELTDKPIELIRPDPDLLVEGKFGEPSFRTTLMATTPMKESWPLLDEQMMDGQWELANQTEDEISFAYTISQTQIDSNELLKTAEQEFAGPIKVTKTYRLNGVSDIRSHQDGVRDFHFDITLKIENQSATATAFTYQLDGPLGTPTETWWYQNKIHGRNTAVGYVAGARDVIGSTGQSEFTFYGGPELVGNKEKTQPEYFWVLNPPADNSGESQVVNSLGVDTQYFNVSLLPLSGDGSFSAYSVLADLVDIEVPDNAREKKLVDCTFKLFKNLKLSPRETYEQSFQIFAGPKEHEILEAYGLEDARSFGWFALIAKPLCWLLKVFFYMTGQIGYGIPIILLTALVRSFMIPISRRAALNAQMMQYLQPQMKEIADKYKDDMEKRSVAQRGLFKKYNYNPFGGCFMMVFQIPIFIALYRGLSVDIALRDQPLFPGVSWCSDLSAPDQFWYWKDWLPAFLGSETGWLGPYFNLLPIITCVLFIVQQKLFTPPPTDEQQEMMQKMMKYMMLMMGFMFFKVPAGLCLYFITSSLWGIIERKMLPKPELDKTKLDDLLDEDEMDKVTLKRVEKERQKQAEMDAQRTAELDEKKRRDKERKKRLKRRETP